MRERSIRMAVALPSVVVALYFGMQVVASLVHYESYATATPHLLRYIIAPALICFAFVLVAFVLPRHLALQAGTCGLAALIALFAFEALATFRTAPKMLDLLDLRTPSERAAADVLVPHFTPESLNAQIGTSALRESILGSIPHAATFLCLDRGAPIIYRADRNGFNNDDRIYDEPTEIMVVGNSFIEGTCLPPAKGVIARLRETNPGSVAVAVRGNGPLIELASIGRFGPLLQPAHVVMAFFEGNDWRNFVAELSTPWLTEALSDHANFGPVPAPAATLERTREVLEERRDLVLSEALREVAPGVVRNFVLLSHTAEALGLRYGAVPPDQPEFTQILTRAAELVRSWGGQFHLMYIPKIDRYFGLISNKAARDVLRNKVLQAAVAAQVPVIDMVDVLADLDDPLQFFDLEDSHFSEKGALLAARAIAEHLTQAPQAGL